MRTPNALLIVLSLSLAGCGDSGDAKEAGFAALQSGDHEAAVAGFEEALAGRDASAADYLEVAVAHCQALAHVDAEKSQDVFLALGSGVTDKDFSAVCSELVSAGAFEQAIEIMHAGIKRFPESPKMQKILERVTKSAQDAGNSDALAKLKGLGYL